MTAVMKGVKIPKMELQNIDSLSERMQAISIPCLVCEILAEMPDQMMLVLIISSMFRMYLVEVMMIWIMIVNCATLLRLIEILQ